MPHPTRAGASLWDARSDEGPFEGAVADGVEEMHELMYGRRSIGGRSEDGDGDEGEGVGEDVGIGPLGSGSDFTAPLQRLGVRSFIFFN